MPPRVDRKCARGPTAPIELAGGPVHGSHRSMDPRRRLTPNSVATAFSLLKKSCAPPPTAVAVRYRYRAAASAAAVHPETQEQAIRLVGDHRGDQCQTAS